jgi:hypothetical protein
MDFEDFRSKVEILSENQAEELRKDYIEKFINVEHVHYKNHISVYKTYCDGECYTGYLWDCLKNSQMFRFRELKYYLENYSMVYVFWDIHTKERIFIENYWKFDKWAVLHLNSQLLFENLEYLLEDIYIFDDSLSWTLILTHEYVNDRRFCLKVEL